MHGSRDKQDCHGEKDPAPSQLWWERSAVTAAPRLPGWRISSPSEAPARQHRPAAPSQPLRQHATAHPEGVDGNDERQGQGGQVVPFASKGFAAPPSASAPPALQATSAATAAATVAGVVETTASEEGGADGRVDFAAAQPEGTYTADVAVTRGF